MPLSIIILPMIFENETIGVIELGMLRQPLVAYDVEGFDGSNEMLEICRRNCRADNRSALRWPVRSP